MKLLSYKFTDVDTPGWSFEKINFGDLNLIVGQTASGKTRLLNTIFNLGIFVTQKKIENEESPFKSGDWEIDFEQNGIRYSWKLVALKTKSGEKVVDTEVLKNITSNDLIVRRDNNSFEYMDANLPKLSRQQPSIYLLKEEDAMKPLFEGFTSIYRRSFFRDEAQQQGSLATDITATIKEYESSKNKDSYISTIPINARLFLLNKYDKEKYQRIVEYYKIIFPFVNEIALRDIKKFVPDITALPYEVKAPMFSIREKNVNKWLHYLELSSGMQKVLLLLTDIETIRSGAIYLIDEYENSLGTNAIDFFPSYLDELEKDYQLFITSHHPYLINNINPKDWVILHRTGSIVKIMHGDVNVKRFGKSKQKAFTQLMNDPFYKEGVE